jgi:hypothetical protein
MSPQASTVAHPQRVPLITHFGNRDEGLTKDAKLVNCFAEKDLSTGEYQIQKRVGLSLKYTIPGAGLGMYNWDGVVYSIWGGALYRTPLVGTGNEFLGNVDSTNGRYFFVQLRGNPARLVFGNGVRMYFTEGTTIEEIEDYVPVYAGSFEIDRSYTVITPGDTDWVAIGAAAEPDPSVIIPSVSMVAGESYVIYSLGTRIKSPFGGWIDLRTDFTLYGASSNTVGLSFVATGPSTPIENGSVTPILPVGTSTVFTATGAGEGTGTAALNATSLTAGVRYMINQVGTTDFTTVGAVVNTPGTVFIATGPATGDGNVYIQNSFPADFCKGFVYLDGTLYVMDPEANIYGTKNLDDPTIWDPLNKIVARVEPDGGVALAKQLVYVVALKEWTTEVFYDAGNFPGSPLAPVPGAKSPYGCVSADSVQEIDDVLFWMSSNRTASPQIVCMEDLKVRVVSTPNVDRLLENAHFDEIFSWTFKHGGHKFYGITVKNINLTLVYDIDQQLWYQWTDVNGNYWPIVYMTFDEDMEHIAQHETNGDLYWLEGDYEYPDDAGDVFTVEIVTPIADFGVDRRKVLNQMRFNGDKQADSILTVEVSDDDYGTWSAPRSVNLSHFRPILSQCGTFYRRAWRFRHQASTRFRIRSIDLQLDVGSL